MEEKAEQQERKPNENGKLRVPPFVLPHRLPTPLTHFYVRTHHDGGGAASMNFVPRGKSLCSGREWISWVTVIQNYCYSRNALRYIGGLFRESSRGRKPGKDLGD